MYIIYIYIYIYTYIHSVCQGDNLGVQGCGVLRMWVFKLLLVNPSPISAFGVKSPHLSC